MGKKEKPIKPRGVWKINPKTRIKPNKKKNKVDEWCWECNGVGAVRVRDGKVYKVEDCELCGGSGLV